MITKIFIKKNSDDTVVDMTNNLVFNSISIEKRITRQPGILKFNVNEIDGRYIPVSGDFVTCGIYNNIGNIVQPLFKGLIMNVSKLKTNSSVFDIYEITCKDDRYLLDKKLVLKQYSNTTLGAVVNDLLSSITDSISPPIIANVELPNLQITNISFNLIPISQCFQKLTEYYNNYDYYIDYQVISSPAPNTIQSVVYFKKSNLNVTDFIFTDTSANYFPSNLVINQDLTQYRNVVYITGSRATIEPVSSSILTNGNLINYNINSEVSNLSIGVSFPPLLDLDNNRKLFTSFINIANSTALTATGWNPNQSTDVSYPFNGAILNNGYLYNKFNSANIIGTDNNYNKYIQIKIDFTNSGSFGAEFDFSFVLANTSGIQNTPALYANSAGDSIFATNGIRKSIIGTSPTFTNKNSGAIFYIGIDLNNILYACGDVGLYKSTNGGQDWTLIYSNNAPIYYFNIGYDGIYIATFNGIYKSTDEGVNWTNYFATSGTFYYISYVSAYQYSTVTYCGGVSGAYAIRNSSFITLLSGVSCFYVDDTIILTNLGIYRKNSGGSYVVSNITTGTFYDIYYGNDGTNNYIIVVGSSGIYKSTDNGATWVSKTPSNTGIFQGVTNIYGTLYASSSTYGLYSSSNNGETWTLVNSSVTVTKIFNFRLPCPFLMSIRMNSNGSNADNNKYGARFLSPGGTLSFSQNNFSGPGTAYISLQKIGDTIKVWYGGVWTFFGSQAKNATLIGSFTDTNNLFETINTAYITRNTGVNVKVVNFLSINDPNRKLVIGPGAYITDIDTTDELLTLQQFNNDSGFAPDDADTFYLNSPNFLIFNESLPIWLTNTASANSPGSLSLGIYNPTNRAAILFNAQYAAGAGQGLRGLRVTSQPTKYSSNYQILFDDSIYFNANLPTLLILYKDNINNKLFIFCQGRLITILDIANLSSYSGFIKGNYLPGANNNYQYMNGVFGFGDLENEYLRNVTGFLGSSIDSFVNVILKYAFVTGILSFNNFPGDNIKLNYSGNVPTPLTLRVENSSGIEKYGEYEIVINDNTLIDTQSAYNRASTELIKYSNIPTTINIDSYIDTPEITKSLLGLKPADPVYCNFSDFNINSFYKVNSIKYVWQKPNNINDTQDRQIYVSLQLVSTIPTSDADIFNKLLFKDKEQPIDEGSIIGLLNNSDDTILMNENYYVLKTIYDVSFTASSTALPANWLKTGSGSILFSTTNGVTLVNTTNTYNSISGNNLFTTSGRNCEFLVIAKFDNLSGVGVRNIRVTNSAVSSAFEFFIDSTSPYWKATFYNNNPSVIRDFVTTKLYDNLQHIFRFRISYISTSPARSLFEILIDNEVIVSSVVNVNLLLINYTVISIDNNSAGNINIKDAYAALT